MLVFSQLGTLLAMLLTAWAPSLWVVYLARALDGLTAGNISSIITLAAFNAHVAADPRSSQVLLTVRDGMTLIRRIAS